MILRRPLGGIRRDGGRIRGHSAGNSGNLRSYVYNSQIKGGVGESLPSAAPHLPYPTLSRVSGAPPAESPRILPRRLRSFPQNARGIPSNHFGEFWNLYYIGYKRRTSALTANSAIFAAGSRRRRIATGARLFAAAPKQIEVVLGYLRRLNGLTLPRTAHCTARQASRR